MIFLKTEYLLNKEVEHVLAALTPSNRLIAEVLLHTGLRLSDVLGLRVEQLAPIFYITEAKTGKRKRVGLPADLLERMKDGRTSGFVFPNSRDPNKHRCRQGVWADIKRASKAFRLPQNIGAHSFRKTYAVELLRKYGDIERVRRALNHDRLATTYIYAMADKLLESRLKRKNSSKKS